MSKADFARIDRLLTPAVAKPSTVLSEYVNDPVRFAREVLGVRVLWSRQRELLEAVRDNSRVSDRSCHGASKSFTVAILCLWWATTRADSLVLVTAPTRRQVFQIIWNEMETLHANANAIKKLGGEVMMPER